MAWDRCAFRKIYDGKKRSGNSRNYGEQGQLRRKRVVEEDLEKLDEQEWRRGVNRKKWKTIIVAKNQ